MATPDGFRPDAPPIVAFTGSGRVARWAVGSVEILGVGLLVPLAVLVVGTPIVLVVRLLVALARRL